MEVVYILLTIIVSIAIAHLSFRSRKKQEEESNKMRRGSWKTRDSNSKTIRYDPSYECEFCSGSGEFSRDNSDGVAVECICDFCKGSGINQLLKDFHSEFNEGDNENLLGSDLTNSIFEWFMNRLLLIKKIWVKIKNCFILILKQNHIVMIQKQCFGYALIVVNGLIQMNGFVLAQGNV